jgi:hypothetical protein
LSDATEWGRGLSDATERGDATGRGRGWTYATERGDATGRRLSDATGLDAARIHAQRVSNLVISGDFLFGELLLPGADAQYFFELGDTHFECSLFLLLSHDLPPPVE